MKTIEFRRRVPRSAWFQGLLDREAGTEMQPHEIDTEWHGPWFQSEYVKGVHDYDIHIGLIKTGHTIRMTNAEREIERLEREARFNEESG